MASASRTVGASLSRLDRAWADDTTRRRWLKDGRVEIRSRTLNESLRLSWDGGKSRVDVLFYAKGKDKSQVTVDHCRLANAAEVKRMKAFWSASLDGLEGTLES